jgi:hypothetical protein
VARFPITIKPPTSQCFNYHFYQVKFITVYSISSINISVYTYLALATTRLHIQYLINSLKITAQFIITISHTQEIILSITSTSVLTNSYNDTTRSWNYLGFGYTLHAYVPAEHRQNTSYIFLRKYINVYYQQIYTTTHEIKLILHNFDPFYHTLA